MADEKKKVLSNEISIKADADAVWRALTEGEELKRWFPPDARVRPGAGGGMWLSWGEGMEWEAPIELWEPKRHVRTIDPPPSALAVDYIIEARGGETVMRIVHSGFAADTWEDELETMNNGWRAFLANLRFYLERHPGEPRTLAWYRHPVVQMPRPDAYARMLDAFGIDSRSLQAGGRYSATAKSGDRFEGVVDVLAPGGNLSATVENWNGAFLIIEIEPGRGQCRPAFWLSLYGEAGAEAPAIEARLREIVDASLGQ